MNAYLFVYDKDQITDYNALHERIKTDPNISNWWHYLNSAYILLSNSNANQLAASIRSYFPNGKFLITKITRSDYQGYLARDAWNWILKNVPNY